MTVRKLREFLATIDGETKVVIERAETYQIDDVEIAPRPVFSITLRRGRAEVAEITCVVLYAGACLDARPA